MTSKILSYSRFISINGSPLSPDRQRLIKSMSLVNNASGSDTLTLLVSDPDMIFLEDDIFIENASVVFKVALSNDGTTAEFEGYISAIDISFNEDGTIDMTIYCMDNSYLMNREKKSKSWNNAKTSDIVRSVMGTNYPSFTLFIDDTGEITQGQLEKDPSNPNPLVQETTTQNDQTDMEFFLQLASEQIEDYVCYVYRNEFHFEKKRMLQYPQAILWYRQKTKDIQSFSPQINKETKKQQVTSKQISLVTNKLSSYVASESTVDREVQGNPVTTSSYRS